MNDPSLHGLYLITDTTLCEDIGIERAVDEALEAGVRIIQYRDKSNDGEKRLAEAGTLRAICRAHDALFIVNDDIELAKTVGADGVHLGKDDKDIAYARQQLGGDAVIGVSCYNDFDRALAAEVAGAAYVAFGSVFASPTKPDAPTAPLDLFSRARDELAIPACAIGGIAVENIEIVASAGAQMFAVISAILGADDRAKAIEELQRGIRRD